jgi:hypothetical protein
MARTMAGLVRMAVLIAGAAPRMAAASGPESVVVLHVADYAHVSRGVLTEAEQLAAEVYRKAGVRAVWTDGAAATAQPDGAFHVNVVLLSKDMVVKKSQSDGIPEQVLGRAARPTRRAYIFYDRVAYHAKLTGSGVPVLLGAVIAHEVGHLVLPGYSHSHSGIMRASWEVPLVRVPGFTSDQGTTIRSLLARASRN